MTKEKGVKIKVGGVYYTCFFGEEARRLDPSEGRSATGYLWGETDFIKHTIRVYNHPTDKDTVAVTFFHELAHAIVAEYHIKSMREEADASQHNEDAIDLLGVGLKEAMASLGVDVVKILKEKI